MKIKLKSSRSKRIDSYRDVGRFSARKRTRRYDSFRGRIIENQEREKKSSPEILLREEIARLKPGEERLCTRLYTLCIVLVNFHEARSSERSMAHLGGFRRVILDEEVIEAEARITTRKSTARVAGAPLDSLRGSYQAVTMSMVPLVSRGWKPASTSPCFAQGHRRFASALLHQSLE